MANNKKPDLEKISRKIRIDIIKMISKAGSGHPAGSLGMVEVFVTLYFDILNHDPKNPDWLMRDRLILSNGHICPVLYACLAHSGYFSPKQLSSLRKFGSPLQGHPERTKLSGVEITSGPLGSGLAQAAGIALAAKMDGMRFRVFAITSDGEHNEGSHWEAIMFASKYRLTNLTQIIDRNKIQLSGNTEDIMPIEPFVEKYKSFNWHVIEINGHDFDEIKDAISQARNEYQAPTAIIANTIPGKGVSFMENRYEWHGKAPNKIETKKALKELVSHDK